MEKEARKDIRISESTNRTEIGFDVPDDGWEDDIISEGDRSGKKLTREVSDKSCS